MQAIVLVGGEGTRMRPLTYTTPKQLLPIAGTTMLERVLGHLARHGVSEAVLSLGYLPDRFLEAFPKGEAAGVKLRYAVEPELLDTAGAIGFAAREAGVEGTFLVVNGDVITDLDVTALIEFHRARSAEATIALHPVEDPSAFGVVPTDDQGRVLEFVEKPDRDKAPTNLINAGTYIMEASVLDRIPQGRRVSVERETFPLMVEAGSLYAHADAGYWLDTGTPASYLRSNLDLLNGSREGIPVEGARRVEASVWVRGDVKVEGSLRGASLAGNASVISAGAEVLDSILGEGVEIAASARITRSVLMDGVKIGEGAQVTDSIVGFGAVLGARTDIEALSVIGAGAQLPEGVKLSGERFGGPEEA